MLPSKAVNISKSKVYKALEYYKKHDTAGMYLDINIKKLNSYSDIEYLTILYALGYIEQNGDFIIKKIYF